MSRQTLGLLAATMVFLGILPLAAMAAKTDVVILVNGNAVTGEVKSLEFGSLRYSTDSMGTVNIDWEDIVSVTSQQDLQIELADGSWETGFICEGFATAGAEDITPLGGWRAYLARQATV